MPFVRLARKYAPNVATCVPNVTSVQTAKPLAPNVTSVTPAKRIFVPTAVNAKIVSSLHTKV